MKHLKYLSYIVRHKWFVLLACFRRGLYWQGIVHDWSKFMPDEWMAYAESFYGEKPSAEDRRRAVMVLGHDPYPDPLAVRDAFDVAWLKHQHRSPHHWQHWVLREDSGKTMALEMPERYRLEMLSDWDGAGRAITGKIGGTKEWYLKNYLKIVLHERTRYLVDRDLGVTEGRA